MNIEENKIEEVQPNFMSWQEYAVVVGIAATIILTVLNLL